MDDDLLFLRIVGVSHYQGALERCAAGQAVRFVHEPDNPFDEMAMRVVSLLDETIGYIPRTSWLRRLVHEQGRGVSGVIASIGYSRACLLGVTLSITLSDDLVDVQSYYPGAPAPEPPKDGFRYWIKTPADAARLVAARR